MTSELLSLADAKAHLRINTACTDDDAYITALIKAARLSAENFTGKQIGSQTWLMYQDEFSLETTISKAPINSIVSVTYKDEDGATQQITDYNTDLTGFPSRLEVKDLPALYEYGYNQFTVEFIAGFTTLPDDLKQAMLFIIGHLYENRQDVVTGTIATTIPQASQYLMQPYRDYEFW